MFWFIKQLPDLEALPVFYSLRIPYREEVGSSKCRITNGQLLYSQVCSRIPERIQPDLVQLLLIDPVA